MVKILVINSGSSSIKFQVIKMPTQETLCKGLVERLGFTDARVTYETTELTHQEEKPIEDHHAGLLTIHSLITHVDIGILESTDDIAIVSHRIVHGGSNFNEPVYITPEVLQRIDELSILAPLHNPANILGVKVAVSIFKKAKQIAVFDTAFHHTIPPVAFKYAIPNTIADNHNIRVYGFHGTSHKYVSKKAIEFLGERSGKLITIHLGNGCSMTAIRDGKSIDHSLGFGPANGLIMGTRSGDIDHSIIFYLMDSLGYSYQQVNELLQKKSGLLGLTGFSDMRDIQREAAAGNSDCILALEMVAYRIKKYIGSYVAVLDGLDAIVFTGGIGENSALLRSMICKNLNAFGIVLNTEKNSELISGPVISEINTSESTVKILVVPTNEELEIARQCYSLVEIENKC
ncbi:acetate kinase [Fulvivirgaceae bacterium BMA10]|uniref:Acetate kinase n=1 Tax=Splendidivirga corallicola TaxID=3051826 RepID=A0ABT8KNR9_9BACT|nr:acetate kinase [Fulvivirgaceae bacterium BMA10]